VDPLEIADDDQLYRRLALAQVNPDGSVNSGAYKLRGKPDSNISVDLARLSTPEESRARSPRAEDGLGMLVAGPVRALGFLVRHDPLPDNNAHSLIEGPNDRVKSRLLAEMTVLLVRPRPA
jgi:hypothetical protein